MGADARSTPATRKAHTGSASCGASLRATLSMGE